MKLKLPDSFSNLQKTLLITLHGKAVESRWENSLLKDYYAAEAEDQIDFDFSRSGLTRDGIVALAVRAKSLDDWAWKFIQSHDQANVVHLGCGLDSRVFRLDPAPDIAWWEVDFIEVIKLRNQVFDVREGCQTIGASILDDQWLHHIPHNRPTLIVAEGVFAYFESEQVHEVLRRVVKHFDQGEIILDAYNGWGVTLLNQLPIIKNAGARLQWRLGDPNRLESEISGLRLVAEWTDFSKDYVGRASRIGQLGFRLSQFIRPLRRMGQLLRFQFGALS